MENRRIPVVDTFNEDTRYKIILSIIVVSLLYVFSEALLRHTSCIDQTVYDGTRAE